MHQQSFRNPRDSDLRLLKREHGAGMEISVTFNKSDATNYSKRLMARALYSKGKHFIAAAVLLKRHQGCDNYVVLHLLCQGTEIILKALLLVLDFDKYSKQQIGYRHNLLSLAAATTAAFGLQPMRAPLAEELRALNIYYSNNLLRYDGLQDILIDPATIESSRLLRRVAAIIRLTDRQLAQSGGGKTLI